MKGNDLYVDVLLPLALPGAFTYHVPPTQQDRVVTGKRVIVQFGRRKYYSAIIYRVHRDQPTGYRTKPVQTVLDDQPVINAFQLKLWEWLSDYYMCSMGDVYKAAMPSGLKLESETRVVYRPSFQPEQVSLTEKEALLLEVVKERQVTGLKDLTEKTGRKDVLPIVHALMQKGALSVEERLRDAYKPRKASFVSLNFSPQDEEALNRVFEKLKNAPRQVELVMQMIRMSGNNGQDLMIKKQQLLRQVSVSSSVLKSLIDKGILLEQEQEVSRLQQGEGEGEAAKGLTDAQQQAFQSVQQQFREKGVVLLHGVTSSGKTELYIHLIREQLEKGYQVLYLLPEIALTSQIIHRLKAVFGDQVGVYHSRFPDSERVEIYNQLLDASNVNRYQVILGVRSSVFLPFSRLGLVIVDEEHENTYKQFDPAPRYHARDVAIVLASMHRAGTLLGTATPSIESYYNARRGKYGLVELFTRYLDIQLPEILIGDVLEARRRKKMSSHFTPLLLEHMQKALENHEQVILFQNRRGFAPYMECADCSWIPQCKHCDVSLTYHRKSKNLVCHYCGYAQRIPDTCPSCGSHNIITRGFGTEKVEDEIQIYFPDARIRRMDLDSTRARHAYEKIIHAFEDQEIDILVGTQMVTKGLDFDHVSVVGVLNADNMLNFPDFRAFERGYQLMAQVSGRAGRKKKRGEVIIQTSQASHPIIKQVIDNDYEEMYRSQLQERKEFMYPPYYKMIRVLMKHKKTDVLNDAARSLVDRLKQVFGYRVLGPQDPIVGRIQNYYLKHVILKIEKERSLARSKQIILKKADDLKKDPAFRSLQIHFDVDPL
ncbi:MAG: primosomal protein N' [Bacteroidales bacterium]|nr:primosomal protein N' [Bacteroidales bacterium]